MCRIKAFCKPESDAHKIAKPIVNSLLLATIFRKSSLRSLANPLTAVLPCPHQNHFRAAGAMGGLHGSCLKHDRAEVRTLM
jgi:hypothetical protein